MSGFLAAALAGAVTGVLSAFGIGGGSLLLIYMTAFAHVPQNLAQGINLLYFLPTAAASLPSHVKNGYIEKSALLPAISAGLVGTALAAWCATAMDVVLLRRCFGVFLLFIGFRELFRRE
ncbi:MAG: sulfite exporter TauE/SafE family protein [Oscillospiraceae bacterium]|nr:sulfite exporter TauE/SafE family protein [Oscillospiraceae bacterium]